MMAQTLHKLRFGSPHQVKKYTASGGHDWLKAKEIWKKVVMITSYGPMTSSRKEDNNCHEHFLFVISVCVCVCSLFLSRVLTDMGCSCVNYTQVLTHLHLWVNSARL